jgi:hypothetical protein
MKSERQQNQETDLIADKIEGFLLKVKQLLPQIVSVLAVVIIGLLAWGLYYSMQNSKLSRAWTALYFSDTTPSDLESIAEDFNGTQAELWARQLAGDSHLAKGAESIFTNREISNKHYENAIAEYEKIVNKVDNGLLATRSAWGLAQAEEGLGKREQAATAYKKIARIENAEPALVAEASKRAEWLESTEGEVFFKWFNENKPTGIALPPAFPDQKPAIPGAATFDFSNSTPTTPGDSTAPVVPANEPPKGDGTPETTPAAENTPTSTTTTEPTKDTPPDTTPTTIAPPTAEPAKTDPPAVEPPKSDSPVTGGGSQDDRL